MRTLVIPDIHNHIDWIEPFLKLVPHDNVVFLGDYFDDFFDTPDDARKTAQWLKFSIHQLNRKHIFGNHDIPLAFPHNTNLFCPGFTREKCKAVNSIISKEEWDEKFDLVYFDQGWTLSHAGFHPAALPYFPDMANMDQAYLARASDEALNHAACGYKHPLLDQGSRMGFPTKGGCLWLDWSEFKPSPNINQIVGHTPSSEIRKHYLPNMKDCISENYCIDTNNKHIGVIENGKFYTIERDSLVAHKYKI